MAIFTAIGLGFGAAATVGGIAVTAGGAGTTATGQYVTSVTVD